MDANASMSEMLPKFDNPPVVETAIAVQFAEIEDFSPVHFGLFYATVRDSYPATRYVPKLNKVVETFPAQPLLPGLNFLTTPTPERLFIENNDRTELIQLQSDRLGFNWKKQPNTKYGRWGDSADRFGHYYDRFAQFVATENLGEVRPNLCEVVYVNRITPTHDGQSIADLFEHVFVGYPSTGCTGFLPTIENASFNRTFVIGEGWGRLYAEANTAVFEDGVRGIQLKMVARVNCEDRVGVDSAMAECHRWIVLGFEDITNKEWRVETCQQNEGAI